MSKTFFSPQKLIFPQAMQLFILDGHELKHNLTVQREAQQSSNMTPRGIQNSLQCNPHHFPTAFSAEFPTALLTGSSHCFVCALHAYGGTRRKGNKCRWREGRENSKEVKCRLFLSAGAEGNAVQPSKSSKCSGTSSPLTSLWWSTTSWVRS